MCKLCLSEAPLQKSHIIPKFIGKWMKDTAPTPYLRFTYDMDKRRQDFMTMPLLCESCETLFSGWETQFAQQAFYPIVNGQQIVRYRRWFVKFVASLMWRAIQFRRQISDKEWVPELRVAVEGAEQRLADFLLGNEKHVGSNTQHAYPVADISTFAEPIHEGSPMMNRYLARAVEIDILKSEDLTEMLLFVKLPKFLFFTVMKSKERKVWETSRIKQKGLLRPKKYEMPHAMRDCIVEKANKAYEAYDTMSSESKAAANKAMMKAIEEDVDGVANSPLMRELWVDYAFHGKEAVVYRD